MSTRSLVESSYRAAVRASATSGFLTLNAASLAGQYLLLAGGNATHALFVRATLLSDGPLAGDVHDYLAQVVDEENTERGPNLKTG